MNNKLIRLSFIYLAFYCFWGFIFSHIVFIPQASVYPAFLLLAGLFIFTILSTNNRRVYKNSRNLWIPFLLLTIISFFIILNLENVIYRIVCLVLLLLATRCDIRKYIPKKFIFYTGIVTAIGILIQIMLPSFYYAYISGIFTNYGDIISEWAESGYGFAGFNYQLSHTANSLIITEGICLYFFLDMFPRCSNKKWMFYSVTALIILCVFLTGKRLFSLLSIGLPLIIYIVSKRHKGVFLALFLGLFVTFSASYFIENASLFENSRLLHRFAQTVSDARDGENWSSDRDILANIAVELFKSNPLSGIGVGQYHVLSGEDTDVHNSYLQVLCEQGIFGFVLFIIPLMFCLIRTISYMRYRKYSESTLRYLKFSLFVQLYFVMYAFTGNVVVDPGNFCMYFMAIAVFVSIEAFEVN